MQFKSILPCLFVLLLTLSCDNRGSVQEQLDSLRSKTQYKIDSIERKNNQKVKIYLFADSIIDNSDFENSKRVIDSLQNKFQNDDQIVIYKGDLYMRHGNIENAIKEYSHAISNGYVPIAFEKRATAYIKLEKYTNAINDLKVAASYNSDYYYSIGYTFELMKKYDSALSYFKKYLIFSDNLKVKLHIDSLELTLKHN